MDSYDIFGRTLTVSEANGLIHDTVEEIFYELRIEGEVSGFRPASSGHWYFTLKDSSSAIDAAVFRSAQYSMDYPSNGDLVVARGSLSYYTKTGKLTYVIREMKKKRISICGRNTITPPTPAMMPSTSKSLSGPSGMRVATHSPRAETPVSIHSWG